MCRCRPRNVVSSVTFIWRPYGAVCGDRFGIFLTRRSGTVASRRAFHCCNCERVGAAGLRHGAPPSGPELEDRTPRRVSTSDDAGEGHGCRAPGRRPAPKQRSPAGRRDRPLRAATDEKTRGKHDRQGPEPNQDARRDDPPADGRRNRDEQNRGPARGPSGAQREATRDRGRAPVRDAGPVQHQEPESRLPGASGALYPWGDAVRPRLDLFRLVAASPRLTRQAGPARRKGRAQGGTPGDPYRHVHGK